jgi:hypothetical protein
VARRKRRVRFGLLIPRRVLFDVELSPLARCMYGVLAGLVRPDAARSSMAEWLMCDEKRITAARRELEAKGLIVATPPTRRRGVKFVERFRYELRAGHDLHGLVAPDERERLVAVYADGLAHRSRVSYGLLLAAYLDLAETANLPRSNVAAAASLGLSKAAVGRIHRRNYGSGLVRSRPRLKEVQDQDLYKLLQASGLNNDLLHGPTGVVVQAGATVGRPRSARPAALVEARTASDDREAPSMRGAAPTNRASAAENEDRLGSANEAERADSRPAAASLAQGCPSRAVRSA